MDHKMVSSSYYVGKGTMTVMHINIDIYEIVNIRWNWWAVKQREL